MSMPCAAGCWLHKMLSALIGTIHGKRRSARAGVAGILVLGLSHAYHVNAARVVDTIIQLLTRPPQPYSTRNLFSAALVLVPHS